MNILNLREQLLRAKAAREAAEETEREAALELAKATAKAWLMVVDRPNRRGLVIALSLECESSYEDLSFCLLEDNDVLVKGDGGTRSRFISLYEVNALAGHAMVALGHKPTTDEVRAFYERFGSFEKVRVFEDRGPAVAIWEYPD